MAQLLDPSGLLNNVICDPDEWGGDEDPLARPAGALFGIGMLRDNREDFFADFTDAKIRELEDTTEVAAPASVALFRVGIVGMGGLVYTRRDDALARWVTRLRARKAENIVVVALASKIARAAQAVLVHQQPFRAAAIAA